MGKGIQKIMGLLILVLSIAVTPIPVSDAWATVAQASDFQLEGSAAFNYTQNRDISEVAQFEYDEVAQEEYQDDEYMQELIQKVLEENNLPGPNTDSELKVTQTETTGDSLGQTNVVGNHAVVFIDNTKERVISGKSSVEEETILSKNDLVSQNSSDNKNMKDTLNYVNDKKSVQFPKYTLVEDTIVANQAFYKDQELAEYEIPVGVTQIGDFAFSRSGLKEITIPEGVTEIGYGAFYHCDNLELVTIPSTVTTIKPSAFEKTKWLNSWKMRSNTNDFNIVGDGILIAYKGTNGFIEVPEGIKQIGPEVFKGHMGITKVSLPASLLTIGEEAFSECSNLQEVSGGSNLVEIHDRAFQGCPIETIRIPESVQKIGLLAFDETQSIRSNETTPVVFLVTALPEINTVEKNLIEIRANSVALKDVEVISAVLPGNTNEYVLSIKDSEYAKETLEKAYQTIYGEKSNVQINAFDIVMYDLNGTIPITKMGKESVTITVPFPNNVVGNPQVVCTDDNGQLERVESAVVKVNGANCIEFKATHFSPDTGDGIHPKWFLAMGLVHCPSYLFSRKNNKNCIEIIIYGK